MSRPLLAAVLLAASLPARADVLLGVKKPVLELGGLEAHPYAKFSEVYNSNVFLRPRSGPVVASWISEPSAGFEASLEAAPRHRLEAGYDLTYQAFSENPSANNAFNHKARFLYKATGASGFNAAFKDDYRNTVDPPNTERTERLRWWRNAAALSGEYAPEESDAYLSVDAAHATHRYTDDDPSIRARFNRYEQSAGLKAGYRVLPHARAFAAYRRGVIHYSEDPPPTRDSKSHTVTGGLETEVAAKSVARLEAGADYRTYDEEPSPGADRTARTFVASAELRYKPLDRTSVDFLARRAVEESSLSDNRYYIATGGSLGLSHALPRGLTVSLLAAFQRNAYPGQTVVDGMTVRRRDDVYQGRIALQYDLIEDWVTLGVSYLHRARFSKDLSEQYGYRSHVAAVTVGVTL